MVTPEILAVVLKRQEIVDTAVSIPPKPTDHEVLEHLCRVPHGNGGPLAPTVTNPTAEFNLNATGMCPRVNDLEPIGFSHGLENVQKSRLIPEVHMGWLLVENEYQPTVNPQTIEISYKSFREG